MPSNDRSWYIVRQTTGHCEIHPADEVGDEGLSAADLEEGIETSVKRWGPFASEGEAIARRVGLIRAGKCKPYLD